MATEKQIAANRQNAQRSTGPRTPKGKAAARRNALAHGLTAQEVVLPDEKAQAYTQLVEQLRDSLNPVGALEEALADRVAFCLWRLGRVARIEAGIFTKGHYEQEKERIEDVARLYKEDTWPSLGSDRITDKKAYSACLGLVDAAKQAALNRPARAAHTFIKDTSADLRGGHISPAPESLAKVGRYEAALERSLYRALHELQRLQAVRGGGLVPVPAVVDVEVSGVSEVVS